MLRKKTKKLVSLSMIASFILGTSSSVFAGEVNSKEEKAVTDLKKGDKAPYDGILLTFKMAADIKENCNPEVTKKKCDILIKEAVDLSASQCTKTTDVLQAKLDALQIKSNEIILAKDTEIAVLRDRLKPAPWYESPKLWFGIGVVVGGAAVVGVVSQVSK